GARFLLGRWGFPGGPELSRLQAPPFGDDSCDVLRRRDVEGGIAGRTFLRGNDLPVEMEHLLWGSLLDRDLGTRRQIEVDRARRRRDVERDAVFLRDDRFRIGADLVRRVSVDGNPIGADQHEIDFPVPEEVARGAVRDDRVFNPRLQELPRGEAGPLQAGPGLGYVGEEAPPVP